MAQSQGSCQGFQEGLGMMASRKELHAPAALPCPLQVTLSGTSVFLPLPSPPLVGCSLFSSPNLGN